MSRPIVGSTQISSSWEIHGAHQDTEHRCRLYPIESHGYFLWDSRSCTLGIPVNPVYPHEVHSDRPLEKGSGKREEGDATEVPAEAGAKGSGSTSGRGKHNLLPKETLSFDEAL